MPPRKSADTEVLVVNPIRIISRLGGITGPIDPAAACNAVAKRMS